MEGDQIVGDEVPSAKEVSAVVIALEETGADNVKIFGGLEEVAGVLRQGGVLVDIVGHHSQGGIKAGHLEDQGFAGLVKVDTKADVGISKRDVDGFRFNAQLEGDPVLHWGAEGLSLGGTDRFALGKTGLAAVGAFEGEVTRHKNTGVRVDGGLLAFEGVTAGGTGGRVLEIEGLGELQAELGDREAQVAVDAGGLDAETGGVGLEGDS